MERLKIWLKLLVALCSLWAFNVHAVQPGLDGAGRSAEPAFLARLYANPQQTFDESERAWLAARRDGQRHLEWMSLAEMAMASHILGAKFEQRVDAQVDEAMVAARAAADKAALLALLLDRVLYQIQLSQPDRAVPMMDEAWGIAAALGDATSLTQAHIARGDLHGDKRETAAAVDSYQKALDLAPNEFLRAQAHLQMAHALVWASPATTQSRSDGLIQANKALAALNPDAYPSLGANILMGRASVEYSLEQYAAAQSDFFHALRLAKQLAMVNLTDAINRDLAQLFVDTGRADEALQALDRISPQLRETDPSSDLTIALLRAWAYSIKGDKSALVWLRRAKAEMAKFPDDDMSRNNYEYTAPKIYSKLGLYKEAYETLETLLLSNRRRATLSNDALRQELQTRYEVKAKEQENQLLKSSQALLQQRRDALAWGLAAATLLMLVLGWMFVVQLRQKRRLGELTHQLGATNDELLRLNKARTQLLAAACHDLRQPTHALGMLTDLLSEELDPQARLLKLEALRRCGTTLADMLAKLMDMTQLEGGHYRPHLEPIALNELMREVALQYEALAQRKGLQLRLPNTAAQVMSDRHLLRRMLFNLVSNAVKYTQHGTVQIQLLAAGGQLTLTVKDSGPGIAPERQADVFVDHVRLDAHLEPEGLGLGLPIVKRAAALLGHAVQLSSVPGQGTEVSLTLPLTVVAQHETPPQIKGSELGQGRRLAVLEDDLEGRNAMQALLQRWGFEVVAAADLGELTRLLDGHPERVPRLFITDLHLQLDNGLAAVRKLRERPGYADLPALLVTGDLDAQVAEQAADLRIHLAYKPLLPKQLLLVLAQMLDNAAGPYRPATRRHTAQQA